MSTAATAPAVGHAGATPLAALAAIEARRYLRHPLFVVATIVYVWLLSGPVVRTPEINLFEVSNSWSVLTGFWLGLAGFVIMNRLARSTRPAGEVVGAAPIDEPRRTLALCLVSLVPFTVAVASGAVTLLVWDASDPVDPLGAYSILTRTEVWAFHAAVLLSCLGGPLLGIAVGRWWRWPMAGAVTAIVLVAWSVVTGFTTEGFWTTLNHHAAPFALPITGDDAEDLHRQAGSAPWRVAYVAALCGLAGLTAVFHGSTGVLRRRVLVATAATGGVAVVCLLLATLLGREGQLWLR